MGSELKFLFLAIISLLLLSGYSCSSKQAQEVDNENGYSISDVEELTVSPTEEAFDDSEESEPDDPSEEDL